MPTYLVEAKEAQLPHHIQGTDPGPRGDLSSHLQTDFHDLQRIGENHLGSSGLQETRGKRKRGRKERMQVPELNLGLNFESFWGGDVESFLHSSFPIILINFDTKDAFFSPPLPPPPSQEEKRLRREEEKEQPLREEERRSEQAEEEWKGCLAVDRL